VNERTAYECGLCTWSVKMLGRDNISAEIAGSVGADSCLRAVLTGLKVGTKIYFCRVG